MICPLRHHTLYMFPNSVYFGMGRDSVVPQQSRPPAQFTERKHPAGQGPRYCLTLATPDPGGPSGRSYYMKTARTLKTQLITVSIQNYLACVN